MLFSEKLKKKGEKKIVVVITLLITSQKNKLFLLYSIYLIIRLKFHDIMSKILWNTREETCKH